jgi:hypothetical protein
VSFSTEKRKVHSTFLGLNPEKSQKKIKWVLLANSQWGY